MIQQEKHKPEIQKRNSLPLVYISTSMSKKPFNSPTQNKAFTALEPCKASVKPVRKQIHLA